MQPRLVSSILTCLFAVGCNVTVDDDKGTTGQETETTEEETGGTGTTTLTFTYTVGAGHQSPDLDYISANALTGGSITDQASGAAATTTLPFPGAAGSLGANADIVIDTNTPVVTGVASTTPDGTYGTGAVIHLTVTFSAAVAVTGTRSGGTARANTPRLIWSLRRMPDGRPAGTPAIAADPASPGT